MMQWLRWRWWWVWGFGAGNGGQVLVASKFVQIWQVAISYLQLVPLESWTLLTIYIPEMQPSQTCFFKVSNMRGNKYPSSAQAISHQDCPEPCWDLGKVHDRGPLHGKHLSITSISLQTIFLGMCFTLLYIQMMQQRIDKDTAATDMLLWHWGII